jgi:predicted nucleotidyltransferase
MATFGASLVYVFGSAGTPYERADSDLDVGVLYPEPLNAERRFELIATIEDATGRTVDLVDLATADPIIRRQILANGTLIHSVDAATRSTFEMATLSEYFDVRIQRRESERRLIESAR